MKPQMRIEEYINNDFASFVIWEDIDGTIIKYEDWDSPMKSDLSEYIDKLTKGVKTYDFPINPPQAKSFDHVVTFVEPSMAKKYYLAFLAVSLFNSKNDARFSLNLLSENDKRIILDSRSLFKANKAEGGYFISYYVIGKVSPSDPLGIMNFLKEKKILGEDHRKTVVNLLEWCKNLSHYTGGATKENYIDHWNYDGYPSVGSVISGTVKNSDQKKERKHYTAGCHGTVGVICLILKVLNIPVKRVDAAHHSQAIFTSINAFITHGDDPYNRTINKPEIDYSSLLIDLSNYDEWFIKNVNPIDYIGHGVSIVESNNKT